MSEKHREAFAEFHSNNPQVETELLRLSRQLIRRGHTRYSIEGLFAVLRFRHAMKTNPVDGDNFKLNNNYKSFYSRYLMSKYPELEGFFEIREQRSPDDPGPSYQDRKPERGCGYETYPL